MQPIVLITGCSSGIGNATALMLAQREYTVYATARKQEDLKRIVEDGKKLGKQIYGAPLDVCDAAACKTLVDAIIKKEGRIDVLINNAGYGQAGAIEELSEKQVRDQMETNFFGSVRLMQLVIPHMRAQGSGHIINLSSVSGRVGFPLFSVYNASKFAIEGVSEALRHELAPFGIHVSLIEPGYIKTRFAETAEKKVEHIDENPNSPYHSLMVAQRNVWRASEKNAGGPEDVAEAILNALTEEMPKARYPVTKMAKQLLFMRKIAPEGMFEGMIRKRLGIVFKKGPETEEAPDEHQEDQEDNTKDEKKE